VKTGSVWRRNVQDPGKKSIKIPALYVRTAKVIQDINKSEALCADELPELPRTTQRKYFDYFDDYIRVNCGSSHSRARRRALAQTIGNTRGLDITSPLSAEVYTRDLRFYRHQQRDNPNSARGLDNNFVFDRGCDYTTTTRLHHSRLRRADHIAPDKS
jgi:hypothetical protein